MFFYDYRGEFFRASAILLRGAGQTPTLIRRLRDLHLTLGDLKSAGEMAVLSSVVLRIVFEPELMKSMSSLSPRFSFTRLSPNEACSIQTEDTPRRSPKREQMRLRTSACANSCPFPLAAAAGDAQLARVCERVPDTLPPSCTSRVDKSAHLSACAPLIIF
jgi:hypothetical protein